MADPRETLRLIEQALQPAAPPGTSAARYGPGRTALVPPGGTVAPELDNFLPPGAQIGSDGLVYVPTWDNAAWDPETKQLGAWVMELAPQWLQKAAGVIGDGGGAAAPQTDPVLVRLQQQANLEATQQGMQLAASEEQRAAEAFPLQMQQTQTNIETTEANLQRQILSDKFTVAQSMWDAAQLADQLATAKRRDAANTLASLVDNLVPPGMTSLPGLPGSTMPTVATIDFSQLTQGLSPETDAALKFLGLTGQQTSTALTGLRGLGV